jgi:hypothetical protein
MAKLKDLNFLPFLAIGLLGKVSAEVGDQLCYPGDNITHTKFFSLKSKSIRKPTLDPRVHYWGNVRSKTSELFFGRLKLPKTRTATGMDGTLPH